jgi:hypothetical protein
MIHWPGGGATFGPCQPQEKKSADRVQANAAGTH